MMPNPPHIPVLKELEADSAWLVRVCRRLLMRGDEAEDLVQEAWLLANRGAEAGQAPVGADRARPWLVETVKRLSWNANRREALRSGLSEVDAEELVGEAEPAGALERAEFRSKVAALVMELPAAEREAIVLRFYEGLATAKIMEETGAPSHDAVRQRISRGIAKLRHRLDESGGRRDWQRSATAIVMASSKAVQGAKGGALALALVVGFIGALVGGAILLGGAEGPRAPQTMVSGDPGETPEGGAALESLAAVAVSGLREVNPPQAGAAAPAGVANEGVTIRMVDAATGEPVANQRWFVIRTGEHDYGRAWGLGPQEPNPKPVAEGVTDENGNLRFAATEDALVNLCTDRSDEHARGSWAVRVRDGMAEPAEVQLSVGTTFRGRVVNDVGEPLAGLALATHSYADEWIELGLSDEAGRFELARCADFPRTFMIREDGSVEATRVLATEVGVMDASLVGHQPINLFLGVHQEFKAEGEAVVEVPDVVVPRRAVIRGTVSEPGGEPIEGAFVSSRTERVWQAKRGEPLNGHAAPLPWEGAGLVLLDGDALTDSEGRFELCVKPSRGPYGTLDVVAACAGGALQVVSTDAIDPGEVRESVDFVLDSSSTVRLTLVPSPSPAWERGARWSAAEKPEAIIVWDAAEDPALESGAGTSSRRLTVTAAPNRGVLAGMEWDVVIPGAQLPDRSLSGGRLSGTIFAAGHRAARIDLAPDEHTAWVKLKPLPIIHLRLAIDGEGAPWVTGTNVVVSPFPPSPRLTDEQNARRGSSRSLLLSRAYGWKDGETLALDVAAGSSCYAYVTLYGGTARAPRALPAFGPISLDSVTAESPFVVQHTVREWPERERRDRPSLEKGEPAALVARRPSKVVARIVNAASGEFLPDAAAVSVDAEHRHYGRQRVLRGEESPMELTSSMDQLTLRFACTGYESHVVGPLALPPGETVDLGTVELTPLKRVPCLLVRPDGSAVTGVHALSWTSPKGGWTRVKTSEAGEVEIFIGESLPERILVKQREGSNDPMQVVSPRIADGGRCEIVVEEWRRVRVRVQGLELPWGHAMERIRVEGETLPSDVDPIRSTIWWPSSDGADMIFDTRLPPGRWTFSPADPEAVRFPAASVEVDGPGDPLEILVTADLGDRLERAFR